MASESLCEYKATRKSYVELVAFAKMHCNELCDQLYAADLITKDVLDFVHDRNCLESEKAYKLIDTIVEVFKMVPKTFYEFLTILKRIDGPLISNTVLKLEENLTHEKDLAVKLESSSSSQESSKEEDKFTSSESSYYSAHSNFTDSIKSPDKSE